MPGPALIIEDDAFTALELTGYLEDAGYAPVEVAVSEPDAIGAALASRPCLITADNRLLEGTGPNAVRAIIEALGPIPVVFVTGDRDTVDYPNGVIVDKPIIRRKLDDAVHQVLHAA